MTEEIERLKSDMKHTSSARARAESREDEFRSSRRRLRANFGRFGVSSRLRKTICLRLERG